MVRELVLHVGTHKTGSTAIQRAALDHATLLRDHASTFVRKPPGSAAIEVATEVEPALYGPLQDTIATIVEQVGDDRLVLSHEGWVGDAGHGYSNVGAVAASLRQACPDVPTRIVVFLRRHDAFIASVYCQTVKVGSTEALSAYLARLDETWFRWARLLDAYADAFGHDALEVVFYEKDHAPAWSAVSTFFDLVGIPGVTDPPENPNPGLTPTAIELLRRVNHQPLAARGRLLRRVLEAEAPARSTAFFPPDMRAALLSIYADDTRHLVDDHALDVPAWFSSDVGDPDPLDDDTDVEALAIRVLGQLTNTATVALERAGLAID